VARFDAELYLRLLGEESLLAGADVHRGPMGTPLHGAAHALVAVGAMKPRVAEAVIEDYAVAEALRAGQVMHPRPRTVAPRTKPVSFAPTRALACQALVETANGTIEVHAAVLTPKRSALRITWRPPSSPGRSPGRMFHGPGHMPSATVIDDRGTCTGTDFSGGGSDTEWQGQLTTDAPLAMDTKWIEIDGVRVDLTAEPWPSEVGVEDLPAEPAAHCFLWRNLAEPHHHFARGGSLEPAIAALVAAGALELDDPVIEHVRAVAEALPHHPRMPMGGGAPGGAPGTLLEPWRSLVARAGRSDGPELSLAVTAVTPAFDGHRAVITGLRSGADGFTVDAEVSPGTFGYGPFAAELGATSLVWWAADDRGGHYLAQSGAWSSGPDSGQGELLFYPALDPRAKVLRIMPTATTKRAVITIPLPGAERS